MADLSRTKNSEENEENLKGTFVSVIFIGMIFLLFWAWMFYIYWIRL
jgi:hypothetical protein